MTKQSILEAKQALHRKSHSANSRCRYSRRAFIFRVWRRADSPACEGIRGSHGTRGRVERYREVLPDSVHICFVNRPSFSCFLFLAGRVERRCRCRREIMTPLLLAPPRRRQLGQHLQGRSIYHRGPASGRAVGHRHQSSLTRRSLMAGVRGFQPDFVSTYAHQRPDPRRHPSLDYIP